MGQFAIAPSAAKEAPRSRQVSAGEPGAAYCRGSAFGGRLPTGHAPAGRVSENRRALRVPRSLSVVPAALFHARHPSPRTGTPPSPRLAICLSATLEPRRRDRLPEEALAKAHPTTRGCATQSLRLRGQSDGSVLQ